LIALSAFALDQFTKLLIVRSLVPGQSSEVIPNLLTWTFVQNRRGAYGLFGDHAGVLIILALCVLILFAFLFRELTGNSLSATIAFGCIVGGALGNIVDRVHYHYVVDFISVTPLPIFEVFNVADTCVSLGVVTLIVTNIIEKRSSRS
jgi:signal peptidase II